MNMTDIARMANVSQATVSRILNGNVSVAEEKTREVMRLINEYDFRPRHIRRNVVKTYNIGLLMTDRNFTNPSIIMRKYESLIHNTTNDIAITLLPPVRDGRELKMMMNKRGLQGLLLIGHCGNESVLEAIKNIPHAWLNSHSSNEGSMVLAGNESAGRIAANYLQENGCRNWAMIMIKSCSPGIEPRSLGFRFEAFAASAVTTEIKVVLDETARGFEELDDLTLENAFQETLTLHPLDNIDGLFCPDDRLTAILYRTLYHKHILPERRIRIVSCNNEAQYLTGLYPRPATIDLAPELTAKLALNQLIEHLNDSDYYKKIAVMIKPELIAGDEIN